MAKTYQIELSTEKNQPVITNIILCQGDSGIMFSISVIDMDLSGKTASIVFRRSDNVSIEKDVAISNSKINYSLIGNEISVAGKVIVDVKIKENGKRISSASFVFDVEQDTITSNLIPPDRHISILENTINESKGYANESKKYANESKDYSDVSKGHANESSDFANESKGYRDEAESWAHQAQAIAGLTIDQEPKEGSFNPIRSHAVAKQIATAEGSFLNLTTLNGGLRLNELKGKLVEEGTGVKAPDNSYLLKGIGESGNVKVVVHGKNFVDCDGSKWIQGIINTDNGTSVSNNAHWVYNPKYYIISNKTLIGKTSLGRFFTVYYYDKQKVFIRYEQISTSGKVLTIPNNALYMRYAFNHEGNTVAIVPSDIGTKYLIQIETGAVATAYEPYKETTATITISSPLYDGDRLEKRNGIWGILRDKTKSVFDGSADEIWTLDASPWTANNYYCYSINVNTKGLPDYTQSGVYVTSDRFDGISYNQGRTDIEGVLLYASGGLKLAVKIKGVSTVQDFINVLQTKPITAVFRTGTPTWTPLPASEQAQLNALQTLTGQTNIFTDDTLNPTLNVSYGKTDVAALALYDDNRVDTLNSKDYLYKSNIANNDAVTVEGFAYDARRGKALREDLTALNESLSTIAPTYKGTLSAIGWYRIAKYQGSSVAQANGQFSNSVDVVIKREYNNAQPEFIRASLVSVYNSSKINLIDKYGTTIITKLRHTIDTTTNTAYLELYYNASASNRMSVTLNMASDTTLKWEVITPVATSETVVNITVNSTLDIVNTMSINESIVIETWITPTLLSNWVAFDASRFAQYRKHLGKVILRGMVKSGTIGSTMFLLPAGYRPTKNINVAISSNNSYGNIVVETTGNVICNIGNNAWVSLDGVEFYID